MFFFFYKENNKNYITPYNQVLRSSKNYFSEKKITKNYITTYGETLHC